MKLTTKLLILFTAILIFSINSVCAESPLNQSYVNDTTPSFSWTYSDTSAINYTLTIDNNHDFSSPTQTIAGIETTTHTITSALTIGTYYWKIDVYNNGAYSSTIGPYIFTVDTTLPIFSGWLENPSPLEYDYEGAFIATASITEINGLSSASCRYRLNGSDYGSYQSMTLIAGITYGYTLTLDWEDYEGWYLYYECRAIDRAGNTRTVPRSLQIRPNANPPSFINLADIIAVEDINFTYTLNARDLDGDTLTISCNDSRIDLTAINTTAARLSFLPTNDDVGEYDLTFTVDDGHNTPVADTITLTVQGTNDAPILDTIGNLEGYLHQPFSHYISASDPDNENNDISDDQYAGVFSATVSWIKITPMFNFTDMKYYGHINFTPLISAKGRHNITIRVTDGELSDTENLIFTVGYCGDKDESGEPKCDSEYEDCETCPSDCGKCETDSDGGIAIVTQERNCLYKNFTMGTYELFERGTCPTEGKIVDGKEVCENISGATMKVYMLKSREWEEIEEFVTDSNGQVSFVPTTAGSYKITASYQKLAEANKYIEFRECIDVKNPNIETTNSTVNQTTNIETNKDNSDKEENKDSIEKEKEEDRPSKLEGEEIREAGKLSIIIFYIIVPFLIVALTAGGYIYYEREKNNKAWILKARINYMKIEKEIKMKANLAWETFKDKFGF